MKLAKHRKTIHSPNCLTRFIHSLRARLVRVSVHQARGLEPDGSARSCELARLSFHRKRDPFWGRGGGSDMTGHDIIRSGGNNDHSGSSQQSACQKDHNTHRHALSYAPCSPNRKSYHRNCLIQAMASSRRARCSRALLTRGGSRCRGR